MTDEEKLNDEQVVISVPPAGVIPGDKSTIDAYLNEKFPKESEELFYTNPYSNPMDASEQIRTLKARRAKTDLGPAETIRRLKSGRKFD